MSPIKARTVLKIQYHTLSGEPEKWNYWNLKSRRKIKKSKRVKFIYKVEAIEWRRFEYKIFEKDVSFNTIRRLHQSKTTNKIQKVDTDW